MNGIKASARAFCDGVGTGINDVGVIAKTAHQGVSAGTAIKGVVAIATIERVVAGIARDHVVEAIASAADGAVAGEC